MRAHRRFAVVALAIAVPLASAGSVCGEDYRDAARHFSLVIPDDWSRMPPERVAAINQVVAQKLAALSVHYDTGFAPKGSPMNGYPYILCRLFRKAWLEPRTPPSNKAWKGTCQGR